MSTSLAPTGTIERVPAGFGYGPMVVFERVRFLRLGVLGGVAPPAEGGRRPTRGRFCCRVPITRSTTIGT